MSMIISEPRATAHTNDHGAASPLDAWRAVAGCPAWCVLSEGEHGGYHDGRERHAGAVHESQDLAAYLYGRTGQQPALQLTVGGTEHTVPLEVLVAVLGATGLDRSALDRLVVASIRA